MAIFTRRRGVGNSVCSNFLFPLGWPACGVDSTPRALRNFGSGELGNGVHSLSFSISTPDQMTRVTAYNNGLSSS